MVTGGSSFREILLDDPITPRAGRRLLDLLEVRADELEPGELPVSDQAARRAWEVVQTLPEPESGRRPVQLFSDGSGGVGIQVVAEDKVAVLEIGADGAMSAQSLDRLRNSYGEWHTNSLTVAAAFIGSVISASTDVRS